MPSKKKDFQPVTQAIAQLKKEWLPLLEAAKKVHPNAYAPYSKFKVAAALEDEKGKIYSGINVEMCNYSESRCAERNAIASLVANGGKKIKKILIITPTPEPGFPCGSCRQGLNEFSQGATVVGVNKSHSKFTVALLKDLLPFAFGPENIEAGNFEAMK